MLEWPAGAQLPGGMEVRGKKAPKHLLGVAASLTHRGARERRGHGERPRANARLQGATVM
eukprot:2051339-Alexandrium_andersonii.AAC.1